MRRSRTGCGDRTASARGNPTPVKVLDFAGGTVVHINAGVAGLMCALDARQAHGYGTDMPPHNMVLTFIGASLLWVGWFGFNAGSAVAAGMQAGMAMLVTQIATAVGGAHLDARRMDDARQADGARHLLGRGRRSGRDHAGLGLCRSDRRHCDRHRRRRWSATGACTGLKHMFGYDDALDCFGVHAVGGIVGALLTGMFAVEQYGGTAGLLEGNPVQFVNQIKGVAIVFVYDAVVSLILLWLIDMVVGLRVSDEVEREGLDLALHGEAVQ